MALNQVYQSGRRVWTTETCSEGSAAWWAGPVGESLSSMLVAPAARRYQRRSVYQLFTPTLVPSSFGISHFWHRLLRVRVRGIWEINFLIYKRYLLETLLIKHTTRALDPSGVFPKAEHIQQAWDVIVWGWS